MLRYKYCASFLIKIVQSEWLHYIHCYWWTQVTVGNSSKKMVFLCLPWGILDWMQCIALVMLTSAPRPLSLSHQLSKGIGWASEPVWTFLEKRKALSPARTWTPEHRTLKAFFFRVWHWIKDHMCVRLRGAVWCGHSEQCRNIHITLLWRGKCRHLLKLSLLMLFSTWNDTTSSRLVMLFIWVGPLPVTFTYPVAAEVTSSNKKLLLFICYSNVFQEALIFGAYPAYLIL
jgi:hypothetical protein